MKQAGAVFAAAGAMLASSHAMADDRPASVVCAELQIRLDRNLVLARMCSDSIHIRQRVEEADAICAVEAPDIISPVDALRASSEPYAKECLDKVRSSFQDALTAAYFRRAYMQYRLDGSGGLPPPLKLTTR